MFWKSQVPKVIFIGSDVFSLKGTMQKAWSSMSKHRQATLQLGLLSQFCLYCVRQRKRNLLFLGRVLTLATLGHPYRLQASELSISITIHPMKFSGSEMDSDSKLQASNTLIQSFNIFTPTLCSAIYLPLPPKSSICYLSSSM